MSRAGAAVLAAVAIVLAVVVWMLATRPRDVAPPAPLADPVVERAPRRPATVEARAGEEVASVAVGADQNQVRVVIGK